MTRFDRLMEWSREYYPEIVIALVLILWLY